MYFKIKGFKGLKKTTKLEMAPLTILVGKNGSGKSSAISALDKVKDLTNIGTRFKENKMESFLSFNFLKRIDFGCEIGSQLEYAIPINLSFFENKFELRIKYNADNDLIYLSNFEIFNASKNETLFHISGEKLIHDKKLEKSSEKQKIKIKINLDFLITEFKRLKNKEPFDWMEFKKSVRPETTDEEEGLKFEQKKFDEFIKSFEVGFDKYNDYFKSKN